jgi:hypothetical protein
MISKSKITRFRGCTRPRFKLVTAVHEAGHAVARLVLDELCDIPGPILKEITAQPGESYLGKVSQDSRVCRLHLEGLDAYEPECSARVARDARLEMVESWAGLAAEVRSRGLLALAFAEPDRLLAPETLTFAAIVEQGRPATDSEFVRMTLSKLGLGGEAAAAESRRAWWAAVVLVMAEWRGIKAAAEVLRERGTMDGTDFREIWRTARERSEKRQTRWDRLGATDSWLHQQAAEQRISYEGGQLVLPF